MNEDRLAGTLAPPSPSDALQLFIPVWGDYLSLLERYALPSLLWPGNLPSLPVNIFVEAFTRSADAGRLREILTVAFAGLPNVEINVSAHDGRSVDRAAWAMQAGVARAGERSCRMLMVMPDTIFGNGSIGNLWRYAAGKNVSVAAGHLRVNAPDFTQARPELTASSPLANDALVDLAWRFAHQSSAASWTNAANATGFGGIALTRLTPSLVTMVHYLPTVYLASFTAEDLEYFRRTYDFSAWDHDWPKRLVNGNGNSRLRVLGSSDLFFALELTDPNRNLVTVAPGSAGNENYQHTELPHCAVCGNFVTALRGMETPNTKHQTPTSAI